MRLTAIQVACIRSGREIFSGIDFSVGSGQALVLRGANGVGKSSLLRMVAGLLRIADGRIDLEGGDPEATLAEQAHYLGHQDPVKPSLSVRENLKFWQRYLGGGPAIDAALASVGLGTLGDLPAGYLSAGQRRRLSIARLRAVPRPIWLLDEPTSALDAASQVQLTGLMREHLDRGGMVLAAAHGPIGLDGATELILGASS